MEPWMWTVIWCWLTGSVGFAIGAAYASERKLAIIDDLHRALERHICPECVRRESSRSIFDLESG